MFIFNDTKKSVNIYAPYTDSNGTRYPNLESADTRALAGVVEIADPIPPADFDYELYYRNEQDDAPYVVFTRKSDEQIAGQEKAKVKQEIAALEAVQDRAVREAALGNPTFLQTIDAKIVALRAKLA